MCIRDSRLIEQAAQLLVEAKQAGIFAGWGARDASPLLIEPVSYTHLRAHETVLDLVCRLLLEKKKN